MSHSHPGGTLQDLLGERGMTQAELSRSIKRPLKTINEIVKGKAGISVQTAIDLESVFHVPAEFWLTRQAMHDLAKARRTKR